jgi:hypothetical protein
MCLIMAFHESWNMQQAIYIYTDINVVVSDGLHYPFADYHSVVRFRRIRKIAKGDG